ncbi:diacylglycerol kinase [Candidatus Kaiserbacteria bacterium]|nr:diacylglycerol kinase [Candidatus Kaiserbacteria bacterium]
MKKIITRYSHPIRGILYALRNDRSYRTQVYSIGLVVVAVFMYFEPLAVWEVLFVLLAYALVLITELQNSALEAALDRLHPELHDMIGKSKDMAAGAVLTAGLFLLIVVVALFVGRL